MDAALRTNAESWIAEDPDPVTRAELEGVLARGDEADLADRFAMRLEFGTAGLRGVLGAGPNRMNRLVVIQTSAGLARYLLERTPDAKRRGVVIGYDGRRMSREFAADTAAILAGHGIPAHVFGRLAPTPATAFMVTRLGAAAGVMITASHNPPEYNGYKVYWSNGAQIVPPHDKGIAAAIEAVGPVASLPRVEEAEARSQGLFRDVADADIEAYFAAVRALSRSKEGREKVSIVYTPLHGVGGAWTLRALSEAGFTKVHPVPEQLEPDGAFPTVRFPNPEEEGAMDLSLALAKRVGAELVLASDPDADRLAVAVRKADGSYQQLSGNQVGVLFGGYLLVRHGGDDPKRLAITTIVSSPMLGQMCRELGVGYAEVLTGFKWIANRAMDEEQARGASFVFGYEEALGYSIGTVARDKDGVGAAAVFAELAADAAARGSSVLAELEALYRRFGLYVSKQVSATMKGADGLARIGRIMEAFRKSPPAELGGLRVEAIRDYKAGTRAVVGAPGGGEPLGLPASNVIAYELAGGHRVILRPSGTEPKIKYYFDVREPVAAGEPLTAAEARAAALLDRLATDFVKRADAVP